MSKQRTVLIGIIFLMFLSSCSFLQYRPSLKPQTADWQSESHHSVAEADWTCPYSFKYVTDSFTLTFGSAIQTPNIFFGPPYVPVIPNFFYYGYRLIRWNHYTYFVDLKFDFDSAGCEIDLSKIHFYKSEQKEIEVYETRKQSDWHWCSLKSNLGRVNGLTESVDTVISEKIIKVNNSIMVRFNLKVNQYKIRNLEVKFDNDFIVGRMTNVPPIKLKRYRSYHLEPFIFAS